MKRYLILLVVTALIPVFLAACSESSHQMSGQMSGESGHEDHSAHKKTATISEDGRVIEFSENAPVIDLIDQDGRPVKNDDLTGKAVLINFIYAHCDESCPVMVHKFMDIAAELKGHMGKDLILLSITMDPERDTPDMLKGYAEKIRADESYWRFLTGEKDKVENTIKAFNFFFMKNEDGTFAHDNKIMMLDKDGRWKYIFNVLSVPVDIAVERIKKEV